MTQALAVELAPLGDVASNGSGTAVDIGALRRALRVTVITLAGTTISVIIETRATTSSAWRTAHTEAITAIGVYQFAVGGLDRYVRASWQPTGTVTMSVNAVAHVVYADPADIPRLAVPEHSIAELTTSQRAEACITATDVADGYLNSSYTLPLTAWGEDLRERVARVAAGGLFRVRGVDPSGADQVVIDGEAQALKWLRDVAEGRVKPPSIVDTTTEVYEGGAVVESGTLRGW